MTTSSSPADEAEKLASAMLQAMREWGDGEVHDAAVPLAALVGVVETCLKQFPEHRRRPLTIDFANSLLRRMKVKAGVTDHRQ